MIKKILTSLMLLSLIYVVLVGAEECPVESAPMCEEGTEIQTYIGEDGCEHARCVPTCPVVSPPICEEGTEIETYIGENGCKHVRCVQTPVIECKTGWQCVNDYEAIYYNEDCTTLPEHRNCEAGWICSNGQCIKGEELPEEPEPPVTECKTGWQCVNDYEAVYYNQDCTILPEHENCEVGWKCSDGKCIKTNQTSSGQCKFECDGNWLNPINCEVKSEYCENGCSDGKCLKEEEEIPEEEPEPAEIEHPVCNEEILGKSYCENKRTMMVCSIVEINGLEKTKKVYNWIPTSCEYICKNDFCINEEDSPEPEPEERGFRYAYWQCYDRVEEKQGGETSCKPSEIWQKYAREFCEGHCYPDGRKCGVNSFSVNQDCYLSSEEPKVSEEPIEEPEFPDEISVCKNSCPLENKCYPFGYRKLGEYCSDEGKFVNQLESNKACENNFECESNVCVDGECISGGLLRQIIGWLKALFGVK